MVRRGRTKFPTSTLPIEIIQNEILPKLPSKDLLKFRCVSKLWCSIIGKSCFALTHLSECLANQEKSRLLVLETSDLGSCEQICTIRNSGNFRKMSALDIQLSWQVHYQAVGHINGLICLKKYISKTEPVKVFLWNPSIHKALEVISFKLDIVGDLRCDFDCAFGYDPMRNDYKVLVSLYVGNRHVPTFLRIFTLSTYSLRKIDVGAARPYCLWIKNGPKVFLDGVIYWSGNDIAKVDARGMFTHFVSFDVANEVFNYIDLPDFEHANDWAYERFPIILDDTLALTETFELYSQIWFMEKGDDMMAQSSWKKRYVIDLSLLYKCLHFKTDGEILFAGLKGGVKSYNIENKNTKVLAKTYKNSPIFTCDYKESLVLLNTERNLIDFPPPATN